MSLLMNMQVIKGDSFWLSTYSFRGSTLYCYVYYENQSSDLLICFIKLNVVIFLKSSVSALDKIDEWLILYLRQTSF